MTEKLGNWQKLRSLTTCISNQQKANRHHVAWKADVLDELTRTGIISGEPELDLLLRQGVAERRIMQGKIANVYHLTPLSLEEERTQ